MNYMNRKIFYTGGSPADSHNQPGGSSGAPDSVTGGGNDYYDPRFQTVVSPPQSKIGRGPYSDNQSGGISNLFNTVGGGIRNVGNYYQNNSRGILGSLLGSMFMGPLGMILGGYAGRNFDNIRNRFSPDVETDDEGEFTADRFPTYNFNTPLNKTPTLNPEGPYPGISELQAKLSLKGTLEYNKLNQIKNMFDAGVGPKPSPEEQQRLDELEKQKNESNLGLGNFIV